MTCIQSPQDPHPNPHPAPPESKHRMPGFLRLALNGPPKSHKQIVPNFDSPRGLTLGKIRDNQRSQDAKHFLFQSSILQVLEDFQIISEHVKINIPFLPPGVDTIDIEPSGFFWQRKGSNTTRLIEMKSAKIRMPLRLKKASFLATCKMGSHS